MKIPSGIRLDTRTEAWRKRALLLFSCVVLAIPVAAQPKVVGPLPASPLMPVVRGDSLVDFVSDAQSPLLLEEIKLAPNHNDSARSMIYTRILADRPNAIFTLGDMMSLGFYHSTWKSFDAFLDRVRTAGIPLFPILGNHELIFFASYGADEFYMRFPWYQKTGYTVRVGPLALAMLNSNFDQLSRAENARQVAWLDSTLAAFEADSTVKAVIVACHHPPYTNSTIVSPSKEVRDSFVPLYLRYSKCRLFLSGHCHAFEHFRQDGKDFFVLGGGGGLQQPLLTGRDVRWPDLFPRKTEKRMFHYLRCRITHDAISVSVQMVKEDFSGFEEAYTLSLPFLVPAGH